MTSSNEYKITSDDETQFYHEGQRGEEEADDQFDVRSVAHHQPQALTEGEGLGLFSPGLYNPTQSRRDKIRQLEIFADRNLMHEAEPLC